VGPFRDRLTRVRYFAVSCSQAQNPDARLMSAPPDSSSFPVPRHRWSWMLFLVPALLGLLAITGRSFWIDECVTARYVSQPTFSEWRQDILTTQIAEAQMPLYLAYLWGWEKLFGDGEQSLRMASLPWFIVGVGLFLHALRGLGKGAWPAIAVTVSSAFVWYYLDEARRYCMVFAAASAVVASLSMLSRLQESDESDRRTWFRIFLISVMVLSGISIIGMLWAGAATLVLGLILPWRQLVRRIKSSPFTTLVSVVVLSALAAYYISSVLRGARASDMATTNLQTVLYVGYELLGFTGLGPGRDALREHGVRALVGDLPWLGVYAVSVLMVMMSAWVAIWKSPWRLRALYTAGVISLPTLFLVVTGVTRHWRVLGRHFAALLPVILLVLTLGVARLWQRGRLGRFVVVLYLALATFSAAQVRLASRHHKDDYRSAVAYAQEATSEGRRVWWAAAPEGADYYGLPHTRNAQDTHAVYSVFGPSSEDLAGIEPPDVIVFSRPDVYDHQGGLAALIRQNGFVIRTNFVGFTVWTRDQ